MRYYIITGEPSGDLHAANLVHELKQYDTNLSIRAWGGERLIAEGVTLAKHIKDIAFMGLLEVLKNLKSIKQNLNFCKQDILKYEPDALILVDYPGFNLKIAEFAKQQGIKVYYYISPKVWAWNKSRIKKLRKYVDELLVIFPFEVNFFKKNGMEARYVGNPLLDEIKKKNFTFTYSTDKPIIALLPGSRVQEIERILPEMLRVVEDYPHYQFVIAATNTFTKEYYNTFIGTKNVALIFDETYGLLTNAAAALVTSGTATLETALFKVPQVVCYKTNWLTYTLAKFLVNIKYISLVNIIMDREVVKELIQGQLNARTLKIELDKTLNEKEPILINYDKLQNILADEGASRKAAQIITSTIY